MKSLQLALWAASMATTASALGSRVSKGCFKSDTGLELVNTFYTQSVGNCQPICDEQKKPVMALNQQDCYCGDMLPPEDTQTNDSECDKPCDGWNPDNCGGANRWFVSLSGYNNNNQEVVNAPSESESSSSSASPTSTAAPSSSQQSSGEPQTVVSTAPGTTVTESPAETSAASQEGGGSKVGVAVGVTVGIVALIAIIAGVWFYFKRRRTQQYQKDRFTHNDMSAFTRMTPGTSGGSSMTDNRLDPEASNRRTSTGSIEDGVDFSRRILQVRN